MARKKKQEVILLHGKSQFNLDAAKAVDLKLGELVVEHSEDGDVKLHALNNAENGLGTFVTETKVDSKVKVVADKVANLETEVGDETKGLVKDVADLQSTVGQHTTDISDLKTALGMGGTGDTSVTARVNALEKTVNGYTEGEGDDAQTVGGLVQKVATNTSDISALETTVGDENKGLVKDVKDLQDIVGKEATGDGEGANAATGLVKDVADLKALVGGEGTKGTIADRLSDVEDILNAEETGVVDKLAAVETKASNNETNITALDKKLNGEDGTSGIAKDVTDLKTTVGDKNNGLVKDVADNTDEINTLKDAVGVPSVPGENGTGGTAASGLFADVEANTAEIEALKTQIGTDIADELDKLDVTAGDEDKKKTTYVSYVEQTDGKISAHYETLDAANINAKYPHGETAADMTLQQALDTLSAQDATLGGQIENVDERIDTILGSDKAVGDNVVQKTIRQIANEELAAQLLAGPDGVVDNFKTLQELAAWLEQHPEDAAAMNKDIANLKTALAGYIVTGEDGTVTVTDVKGVIDALAKRLDDEDTELNKAITALTQTVATNKATIDAYTVNGKAISGNPVLVSTDINMTAVVGNTTATTQTIQTAIEQVEADITAAKTDVIAELDTVKVTAGDGLDVKQTGREFTVSITKIDAGTYDDDGTPEA